MAKVKKIPQRMCIGCQVMKSKKEMTRVVRTPEGAIEIDPTGKKAGRGAYICPDLECLNKAIKAKRLEKAFQQRIDSDIIDSLKQGLTQ